MNTPTKMNLEEYKKYFFSSKYYKSLPKFSRFLDLIGVRQWKFEDANGDSTWVYRKRMSPYNPLSYVAILGMVFVALIGSVIRLFINDLPDCLKDIFKWN